MSKCNQSSSSVSSLESLNAKAKKHNMCNNGEPGCKFNSCGKFNNGHAEYKTNPCVTNTAILHNSSSDSARENIIKCTNQKNQSIAQRSYDDGWKNTQNKNSTPPSSK